MRITEELDVPLGLEGGSGLSVRARVVEMLRSAIRRGAFPPGGRLPSSRTLAGHLGVSRDTVVGALAELDGEGWVESRHGSGTYVAEGLDVSQLTEPTTTAAPGDPARRSTGRHAERPTGPTTELPDARPAALIDLVPCLPDTAGLVDPAWRRAWRSAASADVATDNLDPAGEHVLRVALADHARRARGLDCGPEDVVVTAGTSDAIRLVADAVGARDRTALVEEPGYPTARGILRLAGARVEGTAVDADGLCVHALDHAPPDTALLYVTPSHQFPMGGRLPVDRRLGVLRWAARHDVTVLEDDYDGEFRYGAAPLPAMASLDRHGTVAYLGTLSKLIGPGMRLGYVVAGRDLVRAMTAVREVTGVPMVDVVQRAMADYVASGGLRQHVARQRRLFAERRARLVRRLEPLQGVDRVLGLDAGLHAVIELHPGQDARALVTRAQERGVLLRDLEQYRIRPEPTRPGLVVGYGRVTARDLDRALDVLADLLR